MMSKVVRFGVSLEKDLLQKFDARCREKKYTNRSEAIRDIIRDDLVKKEWDENKEVIGTITLVYNHHKRQLLDHLMDVQHDYLTHILSTQHIHMDEDNCLEIIVAKGKSPILEELYGKLKSVKGVKHGAIVISTTGKEIV